MIMKTDNYVRFSTYARVMGVSVVTVSHWASIGKVKTVKIDGVNFIDISNDYEYRKTVND